MMVQSDGWQSGVLALFLTLRGCCLNEREFDFSVMIFLLISVNSIAPLFNARL